MMGCGLVDNSPFLRVAHSAHSPDDGVGTFSIVKWVPFHLTNTNVILARFDCGGWYDGRLDDHEPGAIGD